MTRSTFARRALRRGRTFSAMIALGALVCAALVATHAFAVTFDPANVLSDDNFRAYDSMNQADIQAFLQSSPVLASYQATEYPTGKVVPASRIIYDASQKFHISPKVLLTLLQKEQSLLTRSQNSLITGSKGTLDWALGMGCPDSFSSCLKAGCHTANPSIMRIPEYRGFGNQIWAASWSLDAYGEAGKYRPYWHHVTTPTAESGWVTTKVVGGLGTVAKNLTTYKLYTYNPSIGAKSPYGDLSSQAMNLSGNADFWWIYRKYFGDTTANPRLRLVYRLRDVKTGAYLYTTSDAERYNSTRSGRYKYERVSFSINTSNTANSVPVCRFMDRKTRGFVFTASASQVKSLRSKAKAKQWRYDGVVFFASGKLPGAVPVCQYINKKTGLQFLTISPAEKATYSSAAYRKKWKGGGVAFYLAP